MATLTERFPMKVAFGFSGGARYNTSIGTTQSGKEKANQNWANSKGRWVATHQAKRPDPTQALINFFHACGGKANRFPFRDWTDYTVTTAQGVVQLISGNEYQLYKSYTAGGITRLRKILRPVNAAVSGGGSYSVNTSTGVVTRNSGAVPTGWAGQFDCLCRFDSDELNWEIINKTPAGELLFSWGGIAIVEVPLEVS